MASVVISSRGGPHGGGADQTYYCFDCDRRLTIIATSDTGIICPICGHVVLEEFETPSSPPSPPPRPPPRSNAFTDLESFFPTSDTDSDVELYDPLPPPPPPLSVFFTTPNTTSTGGQTIVNRAVDRLSQLHIHSPTRLSRSSSRNFWDFHDTFDSEVRHIRPLSSPPPPPPPLPSVTDQRTPCPQFPVPSTTTMNYFSLPPSDRNYSSQYDNELDELRLPVEHLVLSPPLTPSRSSDASELFYSPSRDPEEETPNQPPSPPLPSISNPWDYIFPGMPEQQSNSPNHDSSSDLQPPPPPPSPPQLPSISNPWDYIFPGIPEQPSNSPNHDSSSDLQPPPPPPWLMLFPMEDLSDMKMTEQLVLDWESHQCSICIDNFELNQMVRLTPCNHLYHTDCLSRWLDLHKSCPICRCKLSSP